MFLMQSSSCKCTSIIICVLCLLILEILRQILQFPITGIQYDGFEVPDCNINVSIIYNRWFNNTYYILECNGHIKPCEWKFMESSFQ